MIDIDWNMFRARNPNYRGSFEDLCYHLFCRATGASSGLRADFNHAGLETEPVAIGKKKFGFQSKFFDSKIDYAQILESIDKALKVYGGSLDEIWIYVNLPLSAKAKGVSTVETLAKKSKVAIKWVVPTNFKKLLSSPKNLDLAALYFGGGDVLGFLRNSTNPKFQTLLASKDCFPIRVSRGTKDYDLAAEVSKTSAGCILLVGNPGSGKSIHVHSIFRSLAGLSESTQKKMLEGIPTNSLPIVIDLKHCATTALELLLNARRNECQVNGTNYNFCYLFDGLDELNEQAAEQTLTFIKEISERPDASRILISCRSGSSNRQKVKSFFPSVEEYSIRPIQVTELIAYYEGLDDTPRKQKVLSLLKSNIQLGKQIHDVLFVRLLWEIADDLDVSSSALDLLDLKISRLLSSPQHQKALNALNLPTPKALEILTINERISKVFQAAFQFRFSLKELQTLLHGLYPKATYQDVNELISYIASLFFEHADGGRDIQPSYIYQHRRYQEYFYVRSIRQAFKRDPTILRRQNILGSKDLLDQLLMPLLRRDAVIGRDLLGVMELNLIATYRGGTKYGVDDAHYLTSRVFAQSLAAQHERVFAELAADPMVELKEKVSLSSSELEKRAEQWKNNNDNYEAEHYLRDAWQEGLPRLLTLARHLWQGGKKDAAKFVRKNYRISKKRIQDSGFPEGQRQSHLKEPAWTRVEDHTYLLLEMDSEDISEVLTEKFRPSIGSPKPLPSGLSYGEPTVKERLLNALSAVCLAYPEKYLEAFLKVAESSEVEVLLANAVSLDNLPLLLASTQLQNAAKTFFASSNGIGTRHRVRLSLLKFLLKIELSGEEIQWLKDERNRQTERGLYHWGYWGIAFEHGVATYLVADASFETLLDQKFNYYADTLLYSALFRSYLDVLLGRITLDEVMHDFLRYPKVTKDRRRSLIKKDISTLLGHIVSVGFTSTSSLTLIRSALQSDEVSIMDCSLVLKQRSPTGFRRIVPQSEIERLRRNSETWKNDFASLVDRCFNISILLVDVDDGLAKQVFKEGILNGILRHGYRKDSMVSVELNEAFATMVDRNFFTPSQLRKVAKRIFRLARRVTDVTDGKGTWHGPYTLIETVSRHDIEFAEHLAADLKMDDLSSFDQSIEFRLIEARVALGLAFDQVEKKLGHLYPEYDPRGRPKAEYFHNLCRTFLAVLRSPLYRQQDKDAAFAKLQATINAGLDADISMIFSDDEFRDEKQSIVDLHESRGLTSRLNAPMPREDLGKALMSEEDFMGKLMAARTANQLNEMLDMLRDYKSNIVLTKKQSWNSVVSKTMLVAGRIDPFLQVLKQNHYPDSIYMTTNSRYLHFGLAAALREPSARHDLFKHLEEHSGRGGLAHIISAFAENDDAEKCHKFFGRLIRCCELLVN